jgi:hypothetical protein
VPYERARAIREKVLGPEHPDTATSLSFWACPKLRRTQSSAEADSLRALAEAAKLCADLGHRVGVEGKPRS